MLDKRIEREINLIFRQANEKRHKYLTVEHLLLAMLNVDEVIDLFKYNHIQLNDLKDELINHLDKNTVKISDDNTESQPTISFQRALQRAVFQVQSSGSDTVTANSVLISIFSEPESHSFRLLKKYHLNREKVLQFVNGLSSNYDDEDFNGVFNKDLDYKNLFSRQSEKLKKAIDENKKIKEESEKEKAEYETQINTLNIRLKELEINSKHKNYETLMRSVEFPPEYYSAGLNILSFFGSYLRERYPDEKARVKIEQDGYIVRLIVETKSGNRDIIERALHEYEMVISGEKNPSQLPITPEFVHELSTELKLTKVRLEITHENLLIQTGRVEQLLTIISSSFSANHSVAIDFKPNISSNSVNNIQLTSLIPQTIGALRELQNNDAINNHPELKHELKAIDHALQSLEGSNDCSEIRCSGAMNKFRRFIESLDSTESTLIKALQKIDNGIDIARDLCTKYNAIADWCGLPQVPKILTKNT